MHSRSPLQARGGSSRDSGKKKVEPRARARIPGAGGAPAPRPRPATHGAGVAKASSRSPSESRCGVVKGERRAAGSRTGSADACRGPRGRGGAAVRPREARGRQQGHERLRGTGALLAAATAHHGSPGRPVPAALAAHRKRPAHVIACDNPPPSRHLPARKRNRPVVCWNRWEACRGWMVAGDPLKRTDRFRPDLYRSRKQGLRLRNEQATRLGTGVWDSQVTGAELSRARPHLS